MRPNRSPKTLSIQSPPLTPQLKTLKHLKSSSTPSLHSGSIKSKISELVIQKKKVGKCLARVQQRFKDSQKKEAYLNSLSASIETRILNLDKRKMLLACKTSAKSSRISIPTLVGHIVKLQEIYIKEKELDGLEHKLLLKSENFSFETRSSEGTQCLSSCRSHSQKQFLRNSLTQIESHEKVLFRSTSMHKFEKETILQQKNEFEEECKRFALAKELFVRNEATHNIFKQRVLRRKLVVDQTKAEIEKDYKLLEEIYLENDRCLAEVKELKKVLDRKKKMGNIEKYSGKVDLKEEEVMILKENARKNLKTARIHRETVVKLEDALKRKYHCIKCKQELVEIINKIETEIKIAHQAPNELTLDYENSIKTKKILINGLVEQALSKEREILRLERVN